MFLQNNDKLEKIVDMIKRVPEFSEDEFDLIYGAVTHTLSK